MKPLYILVLSAYAVCLFSCGNKDTNSPNLIVGKWNLQHEHLVLHEDTVKIMDTIYYATAKTYGTAQFNADNTFSSSSLLTPDGNSLLDVPTAASTKGNYTYSANVFSISPGLAGWFTYAVGSSSGPIDDSSSFNITTLTSSSLDIAGTATFGITNYSGVHIFTEVIDYYYTK